MLLATAAPSLWHFYAVEVASKRHGALRGAVVVTSALHWSSEAEGDYINRMARIW